MPFEFELVTVRPEISHSHAVARWAGRIGNHQVRIGAEATAESLRDQPEKKQKTAHPTTNNANVTDVEEEAANFPGAYVSLWRAHASRVLAIASWPITNFSVWFSRVPAFQIQRRLFWRDATATDATPWR